MKAGTTLKVRGEGGSEWEQDVPPDGTTQRELLEDAIAKGRITVLDDPDTEPDEPVGDTVEAVADAMTAALGRVQALDLDGQGEVMRILDDRFDGGIEFDLPAIPPPGDDTEGGKPNVREGVDVWRTYRAGQGHPVDGLNKTQLQELPDTPKEG